ncbi:hypothetical protein [uncultured Campylobacter sp.]|uniref:hypothetical protein n=1 Tax=uncultured Campylobacter sp. TaxID=218934 RepID=UPI002612EE7B|nr:hypothetical protein [uncultured Campylobacter sp.]
MPLQIYGAGINFVFKIKLQKRELRHAVLIRRKPAPPANGMKFCRAPSAQTAQRPKPNSSQRSGKISRNAAAR